MMSTVAVVGLGNVGLPLAVAFGKKFRTIRFDLSAESRLPPPRRSYREVSGEDLQAATRSR
jgi:UDP-N-acetyl-D-galactosamine dehydrogenase